MKHSYYTRIPAAILLFVVLAFLAVTRIHPHFTARFHGNPFLQHGSAWADSAGLKKYRVTRVHDGDTVSIRVSGFAKIPLKTERVRLIGIDAPELRQEQWGREAKRYLKKLLSGSDWIVGVEFDVEQRDKYGRLLAYLWGKDGRMINEKLLESGNAVLYTIPPNVKYAERLAAAQRTAEQKRAGVWAKGGLRESPAEWRRRHPRPQY